MIDKAFYNEGAEKDLLAFFALKKDCAELIPTIMTADFYVKAHRSIFSVLQTMYANKQPINLVTISDALNAKYGAKNGDVLMQMLTACVTGKTSNPSAWLAKSYIEIIKAAAMRRRILEIVEKAKDDLLDETNEAVVILDTTRKQLGDMVITNHTWESMSDVLLQTYDTLERRSKGEEPSMPSGISILDKLTTGFHRGELTILGARPAVGKSALGAHIALATAKHGYKVGIVSREMTAPQYGTRILSSGVDVANDKLRTGDLNPDDWQQLAEAMSLFSSYNISFMFSTRYVEDLRMEVQKKAEAGELDMLIVDYVQLMQTKQRFDKDYMRIAYVSKVLKDMTTDYNIAIIALAQVGRSSAGSMPSLAELRGSGDLEQDADNVIFLHRPEDADDKNIDPADRDAFTALKDKGLQYVLIDVAKQRQGKIGCVSAIFNPERMSYSPIARN
nr:MAG TPA: DnaB-like replicative helicase [Caudoviricetes sp.]